MLTRFIEATDATETNWGRFMLGMFDDVENRARRVIDGQRFLGAWEMMGHVLVLDTVTGEGALFKLGGLASADLDKTRIWVCPLFEPFLAWLYTQPIVNWAGIEALPDVINLGNVPTALYGYRRKGEH